jgi:hypothetical protein
LKSEAKVIPSHLNASIPSPAADCLASCIEAIVLTRITENLGYQKELVGFLLPREKRLEVDELRHDCP